METKTIRQSVTFKASPHDVYESLMASQKHAKFTGAKASISRRVGRKFTAYDGYIQGVNLELVPNKKIVKSWWGNDWPEGHYSKATSTFKSVKDGTPLNFTQSRVPARFFSSINQGWRDYYWELMKRVLEADSTVRTLMIRYFVRKDALVEVQQALREFVVAVKKNERETLRYEVFQEQEKTVFVHFMSFEDINAEKLHQRSVHLKRFVKILFPMCTKQPIFTDLHLVAAKR